MRAVKEGKRPAISFALHAHQPLGYDRFLAHNRGIYGRSYLASAELSNYIGKANNGADSGVSLNISGSVMLDLLAHKDDPVAIRVAEEFRQANKESIEKWGKTEMMLQGSIFHSIVPLLPAESQSLQHIWSKKLFNYFFGNEPSGVWLPEQAYDSSALELVAKSPDNWSILPQWVAPVGSPTSVPHRVVTPEGDITIFLYDRYLSSKISWERAGWEFRNLIKGHNQHDKLAWLLAMDLETFGEHGRDEREKREGPWQLNNIIYHQIPDEGYSSLPVQSLFSFILPSELDSLGIAKSGSWSCLCRESKEGIERELRNRGKLGDYEPYLETLPESLDGLLRWTAPCGCTNGGNFEANLWKLPFKSGLTNALKELHNIYNQYSEPILVSPKPALEDYIILKTKAIDGTLSTRDVGEFEAKHFKIGTATERRMRSVIAMMEGIYHMEAAQTSCATYWESPTRFEAGYNIIHAANAIKLFEQALEETCYGRRQGGELADTKSRLEKALYLAEPYALRVLEDALTPGKYGEHTHLERILKEF